MSIQPKYVLLLLPLLGCPDPNAAEAGSETTAQSSSETSTGDGDATTGATSGDGDGDSTEGGTETDSETSGDGDGDGDGDPGDGDGDGEPAQQMCTNADSTQLFLDDDLDCGEGFMHACWVGDFGVADPWGLACCGVDMSCFFQTYPGPCPRGSDPVCEINY